MGGLLVRNLGEMNWVCTWLTVLMPVPRGNLRAVLQCLWGTHRKWPGQSPTVQHTRLLAGQSPESAFQLNPSQMSWLLIFASQRF